MKKLFYEDDFEHKRPSIFLAGPTDPNMPFVLSWRKEAAELLENIDGVLYIPEFRKGTMKMNINTGFPEELAKWERKAMRNADCILFWIPRNVCSAMKGLTTNIEFGEWNT